MTVNDGSEPAAPVNAALKVPARSIPVPKSISEHAQAVLGGMGMFGGSQPFPPLEDSQAWRDVAASADQAFMSFRSGQTGEVDTTLEEREINGVTVYVVSPSDLAPEAANRVCLDIHGGGLFMGSGPVCRAMNTMTAARVGVTTWGVDYRMPPDHPYPAALDDCVAVYRAVLDAHRPDDVVVVGASAGGNLAPAMLLRARDEGLPMPAAAVLLTPECDLTESGDSFATNLGIDPVLTQLLRPVNDLYAAGHDLTDPYLSPLFGDFSKGFPPTMLQTGTRDLFLSNTVRLHRRLRQAGVEAELHVFEAMPHGGFFGAPEDEDLNDEVRRFVDAHWTADR